MKIKIGADELILWLRKNNKAIEKGNQSLGKEIFHEIGVLSKNYEWKKLEPCLPAHWKNSDNIDEFDLPNIAHQYEVDTEILKDLYEWLATL